jgi:L-serine dehydratase
LSISVFDLFKIGIGPSSSHTIGPMRAAGRFLRLLADKGQFDDATRIVVTLYGSLALTGRGHGTDRAIMLGLEGSEPETVDPNTMDDRVAAILSNQQLNLGGRRQIIWDAKKDLVFSGREFLPYHPNGMRFAALDASNHEIAEATYYSIGGGFVVDQATAAQDRLKKESKPLPFPFASASSLLDHCRAEKASIAEIMYRNEDAWRSREETVARLDLIWATMTQCMERGFRQDGILPGRLKVKRRAKAIYDELLARPEAALRDPLTILDWVNLYALAVNEENAAGARVVTAPTNGAAGIVPAVMRYYEQFSSAPTKEGIRTFLLTAGAIGILYAQNASISGAEVGCQGEVGVACSMAAGGLVAALGGRPEFVEQAAEIGMEHNLGLTCDPIAGLVQIPCIERNAMGAVKAINAARIAMRSDGSHFVSLDSVIRTMRQTGLDMQSKYKETSEGGLAVNVTEC